MGVQFKTEWASIWNGFYTSKHGNAILISEDDWKAIQETMYLLSIPGMRESIQEGLATPIDKCRDKVDW